MNVSKLVLKYSWSLTESVTKLDQPCRFRYNHKLRYQLTMQNSNRSQFFFCIVLFWDNTLTTAVTNFIFAEYHQKIPLELFIWFQRDKKNYKQSISFLLILAAEQRYYFPYLYINWLFIHLLLFIQVFFTLAEYMITIAISQSCAFFFLSSVCFFFTPSVFLEVV